LVAVVADVAVPTVMPLKLVAPVPPDATGSGFVSVVTKPVLIDSAVAPLDCSARTPEVSAVVLTPAEPDTTPLSALIVAGMCYS